MALVIYGSPRSRTMRTLWIAAELGLSFTHVPLEWDDPVLKSPEFLAKNPTGRVPMIEDDGLVVCESLAISLFLAERYGADGPEPLYPRSRQARADCLRWSFWAQGELEPWIQKDARLATLRSVAPAQLTAQANLALDLLDRELAIRPWLTGDHFTVADLNVASVLSPSRTNEHSLHAHSAVQAWLESCRNRPRHTEVRERYSN